MSSASHLIDAFHGRYARCIDDGSLEEWPYFFAERCRYRVTTSDNYRQGLEAGVIWANSRTMLVDRVSALRDANIYERHAYRHLLGRAYVTEETGTEIEAETGFLVLRITRDGPTVIFASGRYIDRFELEGQALILKHRDVVCDSSQIDTLLALPL